ncbi:hypothetical protein [Nocardioides mesophilus]|uniref:Uncharacterized protein n=1 Tax=Nocardioides mesophilus TaxID=433659 RepID=A0A7G9RG97_9ACTN|nr:hypothetical protein [Nocardioides mesophilus]QNN54622.1 hypothetical protein H9L09_10140 [Nocardioides mesophilus]
MQVWIIKGEEAAGRLVASNFGPRTVVRTLKRDFAPDGVDVVVGDDLGKLARANRTVRVAEPLEVCPPSAAAG